jgi:hypothetical protein
MYKISLKYFSRQITFANKIINYACFGRNFYMNGFKLASEWRKSGRLIKDFKNSTDSKAG